MEFNVKITSHDKTETLLNEWSVFGRDKDCQIICTSPEASARHARIEQQKQLWVLKDLRSHNGTFLNGVRIIEAPLKSGDWIRCGKDEFQFKEERSVNDEFPLKSKNTKWQNTLLTLNGISTSHFPVLLLGPSGSGKDILAQKIHERSLRKKGPFLSVNCSALTETLVESELFGHVKGSFTGAIADRKGAFEAARGGTLFLDEVGDLPYSLQAKLLRALENNEIRPVGSDRSIKTDVRVVAATHQNLVQKVQEGDFREDLYYRLNVLTIRTPALKDRMEDFQTLLYDFCREMRVRFSVNAIRALEKYSWPGNIRELKNLVARASALYPQGSVDEPQLDFLFDRQFEQSINPAHEPESTSDENLPQLSVIKEIERQLILKRLYANRGNQRQTAVDLGLAKSTLNDRIKYYGINIQNIKKTEVRAL